LIKSENHKNEKKSGYFRRSRKGEPKLKEKRETRPKIDKRK
jgi:hypothetical protein